jgi:hypothetical protein
VAEYGSDPYEPVTELGYDFARYELWQGETGFHAMIDVGAAAQLHEDHYKREYDDKGETRYLINAYLAGDTLSEEERAKYQQQQAG